MVSENRFLTGQQWWQIAVGNEKIADSPYLAFLDTTIIVPLIEPHYHDS